MKTTILLDHEPVADGGFHVRALLRIEGEAPTIEGRSPLNLSIVLDRSGSMHGAPLQAAIEAASMLVRRLAVEDTVSVVAYDHEVEVVAPPATGDQQEDLVARIRQIESGGSTNLSGGWLRGRDLVASARREETVNRVLLLTDGRANDGIVEPSRLVDLAGAMARDAITTTTIGFGEHYDEDLLRAMADAGRGGTWYIEEIDQATGVFEEELEGLLSLSAQNIRVEIRPGRDADFIRVVHDYPNHSEGDLLTVEVGDLYAREPRRLLMEFLASEHTVGERAAEVAELTVTAHVLTDEGGIEVHTISLPITVSLEEGGKVDATVRREVLLLAAAAARQRALEARDRGDYQGGAQTLRETVSELLPQAAFDEEVRAEVDDLEAMSHLFEREEVHEGDVKYLKQQAYETHRSRDSAKRRFRRGDR